VRRDGQDAHPLVRSSTILGPRSRGDVRPGSRASTARRAEWPPGDHDRIVQSRRESLCGSLDRRNPRCRWWERQGPTASSFLLPLGQGDNYLHVEAVHDLATTLVEVLRPGVRVWQPPYAVEPIKVPGKKQRAEYYRWLLRLESDERLLRYGCDRYSRPIVKKTAANSGESEKAPAKSLLVTAIPLRERRRRLNLFSM
jgi:hypothetical protein